MQKSKRHIELFLVRHGQTQDNITGTLAGHQPGKLTELGIKQAKQTGKRLKHAKYHFAYVSDLARTKQTFDCIAAETQFLKTLKPIYTADLRQKSGGILEGGPLKVWKENAEKEGKNIREYKCAKGESWEDVNARAQRFLHTLIANHLAEDMDKLVKDMGKLTVHNQKTDHKVQGHHPSIKEDHKADQEKRTIKIIAVSHGGFIMEFHNVVNLISKGKHPVYNNVAKNCSIHAFRIEYDGEVKQLKDVENKNIKVECLVDNDNSHIV